MKSKLKISESDFRTYLLQSYVNKNGKKISDRELWSSDDFFEYTGLYSINQYTQRKQSVSPGTISYWKKKLNVKEYDIFIYNKSIERIKENVSFLEWSRIKNKGYKKSKKNNKTYTKESLKFRFINYACLPNKCKQNTFEENIKIAKELWDILGIDAEEEIKTFFLSLGGDNNGE